MCTSKIQDHKQAPCCHRRCSVLGPGVLTARGPRPCPLYSSDGLRTGHRTSLGWRLRYYSHILCGYVTSDGAGCGVGNNIFYYPTSCISRIPYLYGMLIIDFLAAILLFLQCNCHPRQTEGASILSSKCKLL